MSKYLFFERTFLIYISKLVIVFGLLYFGLQFITGVTVPGGFYSSFVAHYFNIALWLRNSLLYTSKAALALFGYQTYVHNEYYLALVGGRSVQLVYSCLGFGVMSFWVAFIVAVKGSLSKKITWGLIGLLSIWIINITRISLFLIALNKRWVKPFGLDNHQLFNIAAYSLIIAMMFLFDRSAKKEEERLSS